MFFTGNVRKTDPVYAQCIALAALRSTGLRVVAADDATWPCRCAQPRARDPIAEAVPRLIRTLIQLTEPPAPA